MHHTPLPFHWQLRCITTDQWVDIPPRSQILMERLYCDVDQVVIDLKHGHSSTRLDLAVVALCDLSNYSMVRRLTNTNDPNVNPYFPCKWQMYWWHRHGFEAYNKDVSEMLVKKMHEMELECSFYIGSQSYKVDFTNMTQTKCTTAVQRTICCRPIYRSPASMEPYLKTGIRTAPTQLPMKPLGVNFDVDPLAEFNSWYSPVWSSISRQDHSLVEVPEGTRAYRSVQTLFYKSLLETKVDIISIQLVQNLLHSDKYQRNKVHMQTRHSTFNEPLEMHLFHGTTKVAAEGICHNNFDPRMAEVNSTFYGQGCCFATSSLLAKIFTPMSNIHHMFLAKVLVGKVILGQGRYRRPPLLSTMTQCQHCLFDTCVDNVEKPTIFVVFDSCQCYPHFLIRCKDLPKEVNVIESRVDN